MGAEAGLLTLRRPFQDQKLIKLVSDPRGSQKPGKNQMIQIDEMLPKCAGTRCTRNGRFRIKAAAVSPAPATQVDPKNSPLPTSHHRWCSTHTVVQCSTTARRTVMQPPQPSHVESSSTVEAAIGKGRHQSLMIENRRPFHPYAFDSSSLMNSASSHA